MKTLKQYLGITLLVLTAGMTGSCVKDSLPETDGSTDSEGTATVTLHINDSRSGGTSPVEAGEGIKTLRVIVLDAKNKVEFNYKQSFGNETDPQTEKTVTFLGMTTGAKKFYVVANEESLDLTDADYPAKGTVTNPNGLLNKVITNTERSHFPKLKGEVTSLPITGYKEVDDITADTKNLTIETYHAVAKIVFKVENTSSSDITLTGFSLRQFFADQTYLFPSAEERALTGVAYAALSRNVSKTFAARATSATEYFTCYLYETAEDKKADFKVTLFTDNQDLDLPEATINLNEATDYVVKRNTVINIVATISKETSVEVPDIELQWQVYDWKRETNDVPSFN